MKKQILFIALLVAGGIIAARTILHIHPPVITNDSHSEGVAGTGDPSKTVPEEGPHGGKLLIGDGFEVEVTIFEDDVPPEFRLYAYRNGEPMPPSELEATLELVRLDKRDAFSFTPQEDYLIGDGIVKEPHSFDVVVSATHDTKSAEWTYESYEGRATIIPEFAQAAGVKIAQAGPATIKESLTLHGTIVKDANRVSRVDARFPGIIKLVTKQIGDEVTKGEVLAVVESNESLQTYEIKAPRSGIVTERTANIGAVTSDTPLFILTDLSSVWVELSVFASETSKLTAGLPATLRSPDGSLTADIILTDFLPTATGANQARIIRISLDNSNGRWAPGLRVLATVQLPSQDVSLAVRTAGLQSFRDFTVVFAQVEDTYEVRMLELGRSDGDMIEVLGGLDVGERYVSANSFLIKADAMKSGASHDH